MGTRRSRWRAARPGVGVLAALVAGGAGAEETVSEARTVDGFHAVVIATPGVATLRRGETESLRLDAWPSTLEALETSVTNGELTIRLTSHPQPHGPIRIDLVYRTLDALTLSGSADVATDAVSSPSFGGAIRGSANLLMTALTADEATMSVSGSGDLEVAALAADSVVVSVSGSGNVTLAGAVKRAEVTVSGSGSVLNQALECLDASVQVSGSGDVRLKAERTLSALISGSGDIRYLGEPEIDSRISGSGRLRAD